MSNEDQQIRVELEPYVDEYKIFVDTCSLLYEYGDDFWIAMTEILVAKAAEERKVIFVPYCVIKEIEKHANNTNASKELLQRARRIHRLISFWLEQDLVRIYGSENDGFADNVFQYIFTRYRLNNKLLLITQDNNLAKDILKLNESLSTKAFPVKAKKINSHGFLSSYGWESDSDDELSDGIQPFKLCTNVTTLEDRPLKITSLPGEHSKVYIANGNVLELIEEVASGGEGIIYTTNTTFVAKIYKPDKLTMRKYQKLRLMMSRQIRQKGICYPVADLYNEHREFVGFLMPAAKGNELQRSLFIKQIFTKMFPDWKRRDMVELCLTILEKIKYLHDHNIIMGDINPANILVVSQKEVYFVDVDSYQIEDYPCPVGTINYTAPEIQNKSFSSFLRTIGNENFAVATLLFMIMLPGKPPYAQQGGEDQATNIINMDFSYPLGEQSNRKAPEGLWRFMWSHLTYRIKEAFYNTFRKDADYSTETTRLNVEDWIKLFKEYLRLLDNGTMKQQDKMSEEIYPTRPKKDKNKVYISCERCGEEVEESRMIDNVCRDCLENVIIEEYNCEMCGCEMIYTEYEQKKYGKKFKFCRKCAEQREFEREQEKIERERARSERNEIVYRAFCVEDGVEFTMTRGEVEFYKSRGMELPRRCPKCRGVKGNSSTQSQQTRSNISVSATISKFLRSLFK